jgi:hypothetical protein
MKTKHIIPIGTGPLRLVLKEDSGVYIGEVDQRDRLSGVTFIKDPIRVGSSAAVCEALADAFGEMAKVIRGGKTA